MRDFFYVELGKRFEEIRELKQNASIEEIQERNQCLIDIIDEITYLSNVGRKEGLLALECAAYDMDKSSQKYMKNLIELIVDATDPILVEEICLMKYIANGAKEYDGLVYLMQLVGGLAIQQGENPRVIEEKLLAMIAEDMEQIGIGRKSEIGEAAQKIYGIFMRLMDRYEIIPQESDEVYDLYQEYKDTSDNSEDGGQDEEKKDSVLSLDEMIKLLSGSNS